VPKFDLTPELYQSWINAFLEEGKNFTAVGRRMGTVYQTASRAWHEGWPRTHEWARPISEVYEERKAQRFGVNPASTEQHQTSGNSSAGTGIASPPVKAEMVKVYTNSQIQVLLDGAISRVRANVADALMIEQDMIAVARNNLKGILLLSDRLLGGLQRLTQTAVERIAIMATDNSLDPVKLLEMIDRVAKISRTTVESGAKLMEMQRLMVGMPQSITESRTPDRPAAPAAEQSAEQAAEILDSIKRQLEAEQVQAEPEVEPVSEYVDAVVDAVSDE
jgi:hypothetical protein